MTDLIDIALHVGAHKTASTHLQRYLTQQREALRKGGCVYFGPAQTRHKGVQLGVHLGLSDAKARNGADIPTHLRRMSRGKRLLLSEENLLGSLLDKTGKMSQPSLYSTAAGRLAKWVRDFAPHRVHMFLCVRDPAAFLVSSYSQSLMGGTICGWQQFIENMTFRYVDWQGLVTDLTATCGAASFTVWRYEDYAQLGPELVTRLAGTDLGLSPRASMRVHSGLSAQAVDASVEWYNQGHRGRIGAIAREDFPISDSCPAFDPWDKKAKARSAKLYAKQIDGIRALPNVTVLAPPV